MNEWRMDDIVELSSNAIGLFVESWIPFDFTLVVLHTISIIYIWGSAWIWMKTNLICGFIEGETHFNHLSVY